MRILSCLVALCSFASSARADYSKAWTAAKANLPATTRAIALIDIAAIDHSPQFAPLWATALKNERDLGEMDAILKQACKLDITKFVEGVVVAGDPEKEQVVFYLQLSLDRAKASACVESLLKTIGRGKPFTVKQDGIYSVVTIKDHTTYLAWVAPSVVAFTLDSESKPKLAAWVAQKGFASSPVAPILAKTDPKATAAGAITLTKPIDRKTVPVSTAYGQIVMGGGKVTALFVGVAADANAASTGAAALDGERRKDIDRNRTPPAVKTILSRMTITAQGKDITLKVSGTEKELADLVATEIKPRKPAMEPTPPTPAP